MLDKLYDMKLGAPPPKKKNEAKLKRNNSTWYKVNIASILK